MYNPENHYWVVKNRQDEGVFSSSRGSFVPTSDAAYTKWLEDNGNPSAVANDGELADVLAKVSLGSAITGLAPTDWSTIPGNDALLAMRAGGFTLKSTGTPALNAVYAIDEAAQARITGIYSGIQGGDGLPGGGQKFQYPDVSGTMHAFDDKDFSAFAKAVRDWFYNSTQAVSLGTPPPPPSATIP